MKTKTMFLIVAFLTVLAFAPAADAQWEFSLGTGFTGISIDGDLGLNVNLAGVGPVEMEVDMSPSDIMDYMDKAYGFGIGATDGKWMIQTSVSRLEMEDDPDGTVGANSISSDLSFDVTKVYLTVGYPIYQDPGFTLRGYTGFRYNSHELEAKVEVNGVNRIDRDIDEDWADALIGVSVDLPFAENWSRNTMFDAGFGGSEGSYFVDSGIVWRFAQHWSTTLFGEYYAVDFENDSKGDKDWYLYDVDEMYMGLKIAYIF